VEEARGDLLAFCDADDRVDAAWLSSTSSAAFSADIVCGGYSIDNAPYYLGFLPYARTGSMAVWRSVFEDLGGFNVEYLATEDVDFSWRAQLSGYSLGYAADARIERGRRTTLRASIRQAYNYGSWDAALIRNYRERGLQANVFARTARGSRWLAIRIPYLLMPGRRRRLWLRIAAQLLGSVVVSLRQKVHPRRS